MARARTWQLNRRSPMSIPADSLHLTLVVCARAGNAVTLSFSAPASSGGVGIQLYEVAIWGSVSDRCHLFAREALALCVCCFMLRHRACACCRGAFFELAADPPVSLVVAPSQHAHRAH